MLIDTSQAISMRQALDRAVVDTEYDDATHTYTMRGIRHRSVTQTLTDAGLIDTRYYTDDACARGTRIHKAIELWDGCKAPEQMGLGATDLGYWRAYTDWLAESQTRTVAREQRVNFGHVDLVGVSRAQRLGVYDFKTGPEADWHSAQIVAYWQLVRSTIGEPDLDAWLIYLRGNGRYRAVRLAQRQMRDGFALWSAANITCTALDSLSTYRQSRGVV